MPDDHEKAHCDLRIPDELWERIVPLLPPPKPHPQAFSPYRTYTQLGQAVGRLIPSGFHASV
jgi:hypothetical protein